MLAAVAVGSLAVAAPGASAKTSVAATYGQTGRSTISVFAIVTGAPKGAQVRVVTKRFSKGRKGRPRVVVKRLRASGRTSLKISAPRSARKITAKVRVTVQQKRRGKRTRTVTVASGRFKTITFVRTGRTATVAPVRSAGIAAIAPPTPTAPGSVQLTGPSAKAKAGQVIALGITPRTPDGLLAQITKITPSPGGATAELVPARLSDVVPAGELDFDIPADQLTTRATGKNEKTPRPLACSTSRTASASASAELSAGIKLSAKWTGGSVFPPRIPKLKADVSGTVQARLEGDITLSGEANCNLQPQTLFPAPVRLAAFTVQVGPVPIPVIIDGQVTLTGSAQASGSLATSIVATATAEAGVTYKSGKLTPRATFNRGFTFQPPTINGTGTAQVALSPSVGVRLAGAAGPEFDVTGGLKLSTNLRPPAGEPWWKLTAPVSAGAKFKFALWGIEAETQRFQVWSEEPTIAQADPASAPPGSSIVDEGPSPEPLPQGVKTRLTWDSNTDVDLHTWNQDGDHAYFRDLRAIDGGYLDQDVIPGYGPETFLETDPSQGNEFTFGVCQYSGRNANVTVDVRDPSGETRRFTVVLRGRKAAALLTTSPTGITPYVDQSGDWCNGNGGDPTALGQTTTGSFD